MRPVTSVPQSSQQLCAVFSNLAFSLSAVKLSGTIFLSSVCRIMFVELSRLGTDRVLVELHAVDAVDTVGPLFNFDD